jgi:hypothetical protein
MDAALEDFTNLIQQDDVPEILKEILLDNISLTYTLFQDMEDYPSNLLSEDELLMDEERFSNYFLIWAKNTNRFNNEIKHKAQQLSIILFNLHQQILHPSDYSEREAFINEITFVSGFLFIFNLINNDHKINIHSDLFTNVHQNCYHYYGMGYASNYVQNSLLYWVYHQPEPDQHISDSDSDSDSDNDEWISYNIQLQQPAAAEQQQPAEQQPAEQQPAAEEPAAEEPAAEQQPAEQQPVEEPAGEEQAEEPAGEMIGRGGEIIDEQIEEPIEPEEIIGIGEGIEGIGGIWGISRVGEE